MRNKDLINCKLIEPKVFFDERGYFFEAYNQEFYEKHLGRNIHFVQDNQSYSKKNVLRGLHYQLPPFSQAKLVRVLQGEVLDVAVDIRRNSPTFGQYTAAVLSAKNKKQLFIPRGFAHGFAVLSDEAEFFYKCDNYYNKDSERGIRWDDPSLDIDWRVSEEVIISPKDRYLPLLSDADLP